MFTLAGQERTGRRGKESLRKTVNSLTRERNLLEMSEEERHVRISEKEDDTKTEP